MPFPFASRHRRGLIGARLLAGACRDRRMRCSTRDQEVMRISRDEDVAGTPWYCLYRRSHCRMRHAMTHEPSYCRWDAGEVGDCVPWQSPSGEMRYNESGFEIRGGRGHTLGRSAGLGRRISTIRVVTMTSGDTGGTTAYSEGTGLFRNLRISACTRPHP